MGQARVVDEIATSADSLWDLVRDFGGIQRWNPTLSSCELDAPGVGDALQDHLYVRTFWRCTKAITLNDDMMSLWRKMGQLKQGSGSDFLSTHPSDASRLGDLEKLMPRVLPLYQAAPRPAS